MCCLTCVLALFDVELNAVANVMLFRHIGTIKTGALYECGLSMYQFDTRPSVWLPRQLTLAYIKRISYLCTSSINHCTSCRQNLIEK